jgi:hypothetical protein
MYPKDAAHFYALLVATVATPPVAVLRDNPPDGVLPAMYPKDAAHFYALLVATVATPPVAVLRDNPP